MTAEIRKGKLREFEIPTYVQAPVEIRRTQEQIEAKTPPIVVDAQDVMQEIRTQRFACTLALFAGCIGMALGASALIILLLKV